MTVSYTLAGQYGAEPLLSDAGAILPSHSVTVYLHGTFTLATLYTDKTKGAGAANPCLSDAIGNLKFWTVPGAYDLVPYGDSTSVVMVFADPNDPALLVAPLTADLDTGGHKLVNGGTPTLDTDFVIKSYADALVANLDIHLAAQWATVGTETFAITSGSVTQISGTALDGGAPAVGDRIIIKNAPASTGLGSAPNTTQPANGLYVVTANTTNLTVARAPDMNQPTEFPGAYVFVEAGTANLGAGFTVASVGPFTVGTTAVLWTQFSGAGEITVGGGGALVKSGNQLTRAALSGAVTTPADSNVTTLVGAPAGAIVGTTDTQTLTNKRVTRRVLALSANSATPAINTDNYDVVTITAQTAAITSFTTNLTGTPVDGDMLRVSITGTAAVALTWGAKFAASTVALPTTTVTTARLDVGFFWDSVATVWRCVGAV